MSSLLALRPRRSASAGSAANCGQPVDATVPRTSPPLGMEHRRRGHGHGHRGATRRPPRRRPGAARAAHPAQRRGPPAAAALPAVRRRGRPRVGRRRARHPHRPRAGGRRSRHRARERRQRPAAPPGPRRPRDDEHLDDASWTTTSTTRRPAPRRRGLLVALALLALLVVAAVALVGTGVVGGSGSDGTGTDEEVTADAAAPVALTEGATVEVPGQARPSRELDGARRHLRRRQPARRRPRRRRGASRATRAGRASCCACRGGRRRARRAGQRLRQGVARRRRAPLRLVPRQPRRHAGRVASSTTAPRSARTCAATGGCRAGRRRRPHPHGAAAHRRGLRARHRAASRDFTAISEVARLRDPLAEQSRPSTDAGAVHAGAVDVEVRHHAHRRRPDRGDPHALPRPRGPRSRGRRRRARRRCWCRRSTGSTPQASASSRACSWSSASRSRWWSRACRPAAARMPTWRMPAAQPLAAHPRLGDQRRPSRRSSEPTGAPRPLDRHTASTSATAP